MLEIAIIAERLREWRKMKPVQITELIFLLHKHGTDNLLGEMATDVEMYSTLGPEFSAHEFYYSQAEVALMGLADRNIIPLDFPGFDAAFLQIMHTLLHSQEFGTLFAYSFGSVSNKLIKSKYYPQNIASWPEFTSIARHLADRFANLPKEEGRSDSERKSSIKSLKSWADMLEHAYADRTKPRPHPKDESEVQKDLDGGNDL